MNGAEPFGKGGMRAKLRKDSCTGTSKIPPSAMLRPWISANLAISADGKITSTRHRPSGWTSRVDHARLLELRATADALMVGRGTLEADRMTLTVPGKSTQPLRCIISRSGKLPTDLPVFEKPGGAIHCLITGTPALTGNAKVTFHRDCLSGFLQTLATGHAVKFLHCEGGGSLIRALAELDAIDELHLTLAGHTIFGGLHAPTATGLPSGFLPKSLAFEITAFQPRPDLGECFLSYRRREQPATVQ